MLLAAALLFAAQSSTITDDAQIPPTSEAAILAGAKACVGATVDPAGQDARLAGWPSVTGNDPDKDPNGIDKKVASKDGVRLVVKTGVDGGCVVQAQGNAQFDKAKFLADLSAQTGVTIDGTKPYVNLPNGELIVVQIGDDNGKTFVQLVVANQNGKYSKHPQGN
jgi:hypothetical protein